MTRQRWIKVLLPPMVVALGLLLASFATDGSASNLMRAAAVLISTVATLVNICTFEITLKPRNRPR